MKSWMWNCFSVLLVLTTCALADDSAMCRDKQKECFERVQVNITSFIDGLIDDVPPEVFETFVEASAGCLKCVDPSSLIPLGAGHGGCSSRKCRGCGVPHVESARTCKRCCNECRCQGCDYPNSHYLLCDDCCNDDRRRLTSGASIDFTIDVCMDDVNPLDSSSSYYIDYADLLEDFESELKACYANKEDFFNSWSSLTATKGIELSTMFGIVGDIIEWISDVFFEVEEVDREGVKVTTYTSDDSHRSTSHMIFYGALGFVSISAFAVVGTAVVVKVLNKRKAQRDEQTAKWVSQMTSSDVPNPLNKDDASTASVE